ncbi:MAG: PD-(D/E)XK nuclease family protein [Deltaproteobacteria bacterium]|nr:PD-(D/E)XK nuclease family protein [Deltaproteobacteria bacterium]
MTSEQAKRLEDFRSELHISHSQIFTYLNCSLKYYFSYVEGRIPEHRPAAMLFGSAIHAAIARYYKGVLKKGKPEPLSLLQDLFHDYWNWQVEDTGIPVTYKGGSDKDSMLAEGQRLVLTFYKNAEPMEVVGVEEPYSSVLYDEKGNPTDFKLIGIVDCIQRDNDGNLIIIDNKTANRAYSKDKIEQDLQMTVYSYLAAASKLVPAKSETLHRFDVLLKLKKPRLDIYHTTRTAADRKRLAKIINRVLRGIEAGVFFPNPSWMCRDCQYAQACVKWST